SGKPGPIAFPDPTDVCETIDRYQVVDLLTLVQLKLAARRHRDFADVVELIRCNNLDESFEQKLHRTVRSDYIECLEEKRREDEYEARKSPYDEVIGITANDHKALSVTPPPVSTPLAAAAKDAADSWGNHQERWPG